MCRCSYVHACVCVLCVVVRTRMRACVYVCMQARVGVRVVDVYVFVWTSDDSKVQVNVKEPNLAIRLEGLLSKRHVPSHVKSCTVLPWPPPARGRLHKGDW